MITPPPIQIYPSSIPFITGFAVSPHQMVLFLPPTGSVSAKQAKQYLRWHRERYYPVAAAIRMALPRLSHLSDEQILDASFKLADAQELVARQMGFAGWQALKAGANTMPHDAAPTGPRPILNSTEAQLFVADIKASCDFYTEKLGFTVAFVYGDPPFYGQVTRDHARLITRVVLNLFSSTIFESRASALRFAHRRYLRRD